MDSAAGVPHVFWQGSGIDANLWWLPVGNNDNTVYDLGMGPLNSRPTAAWSTGAPGELEVFWRGQDDTLWEGHETADGTWHLIHLSQYVNIGS